MLVSKIACSLMGLCPLSTASVNSWVRSDRHQPLQNFRQPLAMHTAGSTNFPTFFSLHLPYEGWRVLQTIAKLKFSKIIYFSIECLDEWFSMTEEEDANSNSTVSISNDRASFEAASSPAKAYWT